MTLNLTFELGSRRETGLMGLKTELKATFSNPTENWYGDNAWRMRLGGISAIWMVLKC